MAAPEVKDDQPVCEVVPTLKGLVFDSPESRKSRLDRWKRMADIVRGAMRTPDDESRAEARKALRPVVVEELVFLEFDTTAIDKSCLEFTIDTDTAVTEGSALTAIPDLVEVDVRLNLLGDAKMRGWDYESLLNIIQGKPARYYFPNKRAKEEFIDIEVKDDNMTHVCHGMIGGFSFTRLKGAGWSCVGCIAKVACLLILYQSL